MILFCDFDGTLKRPSIDGDYEKNLMAVEKYRSAGNKFVLTTGRGLESISQAFPDYSKYVDYLICDNGSVCINDAGLHFEISIDDSVVFDLVDYLKTLPRGDEFDFVYFGNGGESMEFTGKTTKLRIWSVDSEVMETTVERLKEQFRDAPVKFYVAHSLRPNTDKHANLRSYHYGAIDVVSIEAGKERAIERVLAENPDEQAIAVGDGGNDMPMLMEYDGFIMSTANAELRALFDEDRVIDSVSGLIRRLLIFEDIERRLGVDLLLKDLIFYTDGATDSVVFSVDNQYLIKITDRNTVSTQREFLCVNKYEAFQELLCCDEDLGYACFKYIDGVKYKTHAIDARLAIDQIARIVESYAEYDCDFYGFLEDGKATWREFLADEIDYAKRTINEISQNPAMEALDVIGDVSPKKHLTHGDFGTHNFLLENDKIRVIDPMPVVGDPLYDFYFAVLSNVGIFVDLGEEYILSFFDNYSISYKRALLIIALYVRMSRAAVYDREHLDAYIELYKRM